MVYKYKRYIDRLSKYVSLAVLLLFATISAASAGGLDTISTGGDTQGTVGGYATMYINATGANTVGSLQLDVLYDQSIISANSITAESLTTGSMFAPNIDNIAGKIRIGLISVGGVTGNGQLVKINYSVIKAGVSKLEISGVSVTDASNNNIIVGSITGGSFSATTIAPTVAQTPVSGDIVTYYKGLGNPNIIETNDLLKAADDWRNDIIPQGYSLSITTGQLLALADGWRNS
jgi:hypothetical protein